VKTQFDDALEEQIKGLPADEPELDQEAQDEAESDMPELEEFDRAEGEPEEPFDLAEHYWALFPYLSDDYANKVCELFDEHVERWMGTSSYTSLVFDCYRAYHGLDGAMVSEPSVRLETAGEQGELLSMRPNNVRSLVKHQIAMVTADRPAWQPGANNANSEAQNQVPMATNLLDYALNLGVHKNLVDQHEAQKVCGEAFWIGGWDANLGLNKQGWFTSRITTPWEMARQRTRSYQDTSWWIWRTYENRMDLVAKLAEVDPEKARELFTLDQGQFDWGVAPLDGYEEDDVKAEADLIAVLNVFIRPSASCPAGRYSKVVSPTLALEDVPSPFGDLIPIVRMCSAEFVGTSIPYTDAWMLMAPAEAINVIFGTIMTRVDTFGIPTVAAPAGSEVQAGDFGGAGLLEMGVGEKPTIIDLLQLPDGLFKVGEQLEQMLENFSGVNSVTRGNPKDNISSGSMAALLQAMAVQYNSSDERAWALNLEAVGTVLLKIFQRCASEEVMVAIAGKDQTSTVTQFKGEDLSSILQINVQIANPISKTMAGKMQIAQDASERGYITNGADYMNVLSTGTLQPMVAGPISHTRMAKAEDEKMLRGEPASVLVWDNDLLHIQQHVTMLNNDIRYDEQKCELFKAHVDEHFQSWQRKSREQPDLCHALGLPVLPAAGAIGEQVRAMTSMAQGMPPPPPTDNGPPPQQTEQPGTIPGKAAPGPKPAPKGEEPSQVAPKEPEPAKTPAGEPVV
jgi:hypothetical protein